LRKYLRVLELRLEKEKKKRELETAVFSRGHDHRETILTYFKLVCFPE